MYVYLFFLLVIFDVELNYKGFNKTFRSYTKKYYGIKNKKISAETFESYSKEIESIFRKLDIVCTWYPRKADCIHKTLLGYRIIRKKYSLPVDMVVGMRKFPFEAHAWLQINDIDFFIDNTNKYKIVISSKKMMEGEIYQVV